jgi:hypothetical protein
MCAYLSICGLFLEHRLYITVNLITLGFVFASQLRGHDLLILSKVAFHFRGRLGSFAEYLEQSKVSFRCHL